MVRTAVNPHSRPNPRRASKNPTGRSRPYAAHRDVLKRTSRPFSLDDACGIPAHNSAIAGDRFIKLRILDSRISGRGNDPAIAFESPSPGLEQVFQRLDYKRRIKLLDLGPPNQTLMEALRGLPISLYVGDLLSEFGGAYGDDRDAPLALHGIEERDVQRSLRHVDGFSFDAVLAWDYFEYCDEQSARNILKFISRVSRKGTQIHCLRFISETKPARPSRFSVTRRLRLRYEPVTKTVIDNDIENDTHSVSGMPGFEISDHHTIANIFSEYVYKVASKAKNERPVVTAKAVNSRRFRR